MVTAAGPLDLGPNAAASDAQATADAELAGCAAALPAARSVSAELDTLYVNRRNNVPLQYTPISGALIELHDALESDPDAPPESASQIRDDIAEIDGLPTGGSATTMMDFVLWAVGPAASSDAVISRCVSEPASEAGAAVAPSSSTSSS